MYTNAKCTPNVHLAIIASNNTNNTQKLCFLGPERARARASADFNVQI